MKKITILLTFIIFSTPFLFAQGSWTIMDTENSSIPSNSIISLGMGNDNQIFIGTPGGLVDPSHVYTYNGTSWDEVDWISSFNDLEASP